MENNLPLSKPLLLVTLGVIFAIAIGGYVLFFQSQKRIAQKDHEYELLKAKVTQMEEGYTDTQKKYDDAIAKNQQLTKDLQDATKSGLDLKTKSDELQAKYEELLINQEKLTKELKEKTSGVGQPPAAALTTAPAPADPKSSSAHPLQELNPQKDSTVNSEPNVPSVSVTPPTEPPPPPPSDKKASLTQPSASSAGVALGGKDLQCPSSAIVTQNLASGNWSEGDFNWWVDYTRRPINENEPVQSLFQILFDGQTIACYYELTKGDQDAWIVIKGSSKSAKIVLNEADGWAPCPTKECEATCAKEKMNQCHFSLQKP